MSEQEDFITLKWGTWKEYHLTSEAGLELMKQYRSLGASASCMAQHDTPEQKEILCKIIDVVPGDILLEWEGVTVSKDKAKEYIMTYGSKS